MLKNVIAYFYFGIMVLLIKPCLVYAQDTTKVIIDLNGIANQEVRVKVFPSISMGEWEFIVPEIIPGTYWKVNYIRFYKQFKAFDKEGNELKVIKKKNVVRVRGDKPLNYITYSVKPSTGDLKVWDNILACGGSVFTAKSALINFQLVTGYFEGHEHNPFLVEVRKPAGFYGASSIQKKMLSPTKDLLMAKNYGSLIDQPILYSNPDTCSFKIKDNVFHLAVHAETEKITAEKLKPRFKAIMYAIDTFTGFTTNEPYHFLLYFANIEKKIDLSKGFGLGSALEHKYSSVYYNKDEIIDSTFSYFNWIAAHEYFHTITPLAFHSEKIANFNII